MRQKKFYLTLVVVLTAALMGVGAANAFEGEAYAIRGGTVVTVTGGTIQKGTVIVRNGLIEAVGADIPIPADARIIDATGMTIYPGFFDAYTNLGLRPQQPPQGPGGGGGGVLVDPVQVMIAQMTAPPSNAGLLPEVSVVDQLQVAANTFDAQRAAGITTALTGPRTGVFQGLSALINLGGEAAEKLILKAPFSLNVGFSGARGGYPGSLMGVFSFLRQSLLDAQHYREEWARYKKSPRGAQRPQINKSMEALQPVINGEMPVIFNVSTVREMKRAIALAEEFKLKYLLNGGLQSYQIADYLKAKNATVLLSLSFPQKPAGLEDPEAESLRVLRERAEAPRAAAALQKAGVKFAFTSGSLSRPSDYIANAGRAVEAGLPKDEAIKALTIYPAQILGLGEQLGSIEKGKIANLVLATGDILDRNTRVKHVFIDGQKFDIRAPETPRGGGPAGRGAAPPPAAAAAMLAAGTWNLNVQTPSDEVTSTMTLKQDGESLSGEVSTPFGTAQITDGRIRGNEVTLNYTLNVQGQQLPVSVRGRIEGSTIRGTMEAMGQTFSFNGTKRPN